MKIHPRLVGWRWVAVILSVGGLAVAPACSSGSAHGPASPDGGSGVEAGGGDGLAGCGVMGAPCCNGGIGACTIDQCLEGICKDDGTCGWPLTCGSQGVDPSKDNSNCGGCGTQCTSTATDVRAICESGTCRLTTTYSTLSSTEDVFALAVDATNVYWTTGSSGVSCSGGKILACPVAGCGAQGPTALVTQTACILALATDGTHLYWSSASASGTAGAVQSCGLPGCASATAVVSGIKDAHLLAVSGGLLYFDQMGMASCPTSGCAGPTTLSTSGSVGNLALDGTHLFWSAATGQGESVLQCSLPSCTDASTIGSTPPESYIRGLGVDATDVYWSVENVTSCTDDLFRCARSGCTTPTTVATGLELVGHVATGGGNVFWEDGSNGSGVRFCPAAGCNGTVKSFAPDLGYQPSTALVEQSGRVFMAAGRVVQSTPE